MANFRTRESKKKARRSIIVLEMNDELWDRVHGLSSETLKKCERVKLLVVLTHLRGAGIIPL